MSLRSARERAGWSREALAVRSGLSWGAIAQIESGRRREVRLGTLVALANALEITVDYLVGAQAAVDPRLLEHYALLYGSEEEYLAATVPFLSEGIARRDCVLVVSGRWQTGLLRDALGDDAPHVEFRDSTEWYGSPTAALNDYRRYVNERFELGAYWFRVIGEPIWAGRSEAEVSAWTRYESIMNVAMASSPATIMCPYDARTVPAKVLDGARHTHPEVAEAGAVNVSRAYEEPEEFLLASG